MNKRSIYSLYIFSTLFVLSLFSELISNNKPIIMSIDDNTYYPFIINYTEKDFEKLTNTFNNFCEKKEIRIHDTFYCPHHVDGVVKKYRKACNFRKPNSGMFLKAIKKHKIKQDLKT